jgi:hypothetical protein
LRLFALTGFSCVTGKKRFLMPNHATGFEIFLTERMHSPMHLDTAAIPQTTIRTSSVPYTNCSSLNCCESNGSFKKVEKFKMTDYC